jgi:hypothetical protein
MVKTRSKTGKEANEVEGKISEVMDRMKLLEEKVEKQGIEMKVSFNHIDTKL